MNKLNTPSNVIDYNSPTANMYGCQPCPKCKSKFRWSQNDQISHIILCDDCGFTETVDTDVEIIVHQEY